MAVVLLATTSQPAPDPTAALLVELIRVDTSNPPGNEGSVANLLAPRFKALGFEVDVLETPQPGKAHFIARLKGNGSKKPVLIAAHSDVVGVEREKWTVDPFAGTIKDGYVFGPRRDRLQGWHRGVRARRDDAGRAKGSARS